MNDELEATIDTMITDLLRLEKENEEIRKRLDRLELIHPFPKE